MKHRAVLEGISSRHGLSTQELCPPPLHPLCPICLPEHSQDCLQRTLSHQDKAKLCCHSGFDSTLSSAGWRHKSVFNKQGKGQLGGEQSCQAPCNSQQNANKSTVNMTWLCFLNSSLWCRSCDNFHMNANLNITIYLASEEPSLQAIFQERVQNMTKKIGGN